MNALKIGAALALVLAIIGAYFFGRSDGRNIEIAAQSAASSASSSVSSQLQGQINNLTSQAAESEQSRQVSVREIHYEKERIIQADPVVYTAKCVDTDGVQLLQRAATVANGGSVASGAAASPAAATGRP